MNRYYRGFLILVGFLLPLSAHGAAFSQGGGAQGLVSMEAESFHARTVQGGHQWVAVTSPAPGFSGTGTMTASPNNGTSNPSGFLTDSPRVDYRVNFTRTGTHYLWIRASGPGFANDSVHAGLNGQNTSTARDIYLPGGGSYAWTSGQETVTIMATGVHTINLWMREDGAIVDKILLTTDAGFVPAGIGPAESPQTGTANLAPVARNDDLAVSQNSAGNTLAVLADNGNGADSDPDGDPLTVIAVGATNHGGTAWVPSTGSGVRYTPAAGFTGTESFSYTISDGKGGSDSAVATVNVTAAGGSGSFQQEGGGQGLVSMEAESFHARTIQGGHQWLRATSLSPGFSGAGAMTASPNNGTSNATGFVSNSPRMDYKVNFTRTGTHYLWIRAAGPGGANDSVHAGLNGQNTSTAGNIYLPGGGSYAWSDGSGTTVNIPSTGVHTINLWMREDGAIIDKFVLTPSAGYVPAASGPAESPQTGSGNRAPVARNDAFTVSQSSVGNTLAVLVDNGNGADSDPDGDPLTVISVGATNRGGAAWVTSTGSGVRYTPTAGFTGTESFSYTISDGKGGNASALATVTVNASSGTGGNGDFLQNGQGLVAMEAENFGSSGFRVGRGHSLCVRPVKSLRDSSATLRPCG